MECDADLTEIQENLSYSYLHAVVSRAHGSIVLSDHLLDKRGVDAVLSLYDNDSEQSVTINVQVKSTRQMLIVKNSKIHYSIDSDQYEKYLSKSNNSNTPFLLVLLHLPIN